MKSRLTAQAIENRIGFDECQHERFALNGLFQIVESIFLFSEKGMRHRIGIKPESVSRPVVDHCSYILPDTTFLVDLSFPIELRLQIFFSLRRFI